MTVSTMAAVTVGRQNTTQKTVHIMGTIHHTSQIARRRSSTQAVTTPAARHARCGDVPWRIPCTGRGAQNSSVSFNCFLMLAGGPWPSLLRHHVELRLSKHTALSLDCSEGQ